MVVSFLDTLKSLFRLRILPARVPYGTLPMSAVQPLKHLKRLSPQLQSLPIGFRTLKSPSKPMHLITYSPLYFQLQTQMANCTRLHSTPEHFLPQNSITMFMTKSYSQFLKLSNIGDIILKALHSQSTWSPITRICNTFQRPKSLRVGKHDGPNTFLPSTSSSASGLENSVPNPMHSLDDGMSILKRGIVTMPVSIHRITARYSLLSNWHHPSELLPYQSQPFVDLSSWMLKGSILTFSLNSERIPLPKNTSITSQTPVGPLTQMVYYVTSDASMFRTLAIFDYVFFNIHMIIPLQVISVR